jgi:hypothetical protein
LWHSITNQYHKKGLFTGFNTTDPRIFRAIRREISVSRRAPAPPAFTIIGKKHIPGNKGSSRKEVAMRYLFVLFLFCCSPAANAGEDVPLPAPPFPTVNDSQIRLYHAVLHDAFPESTPEEISDRLAMMQDGIQKHAAALLSEGQARYGLPNRPLPLLRWDLLIGGDSCVRIGEAWPDSTIRLNVIAILFGYDTVLRSVGPHEVARILFFQKYGSTLPEWAENAQHGERWKAIMHDLVGFVDTWYPAEFSDALRSFTFVLQVAAGTPGQRNQWAARIVQENSDLARSNPAVRIPPFQFVKQN